MRKASMGTLFLTVFLDLLGFGLVVPFLPGVARSLGASDFSATALGAAYSLMQFLFIPLWARLSDKIGRRPVLLVSISASVVGMVMLGLANSVVTLFAARVFSGMATANIAVAQAYIADVTTPDKRARGMGMIGMGFGLGFMFGPFIGGELGHFEILGRQGTLAAFAAAGLSLLNLVFAYVSLPESLSPELRGQAVRRRVMFDFEGFKRAGRIPGVLLAVLISFLVTFWFAGMEQTFRLFTADAFNLGVAATGRIFGFVGIVAVIVQGGLIHRLSRRFGEVKLIRVGAFLLALGFALMGISPSFPGAGLFVLFAAAGTIAAGSGLQNPSASSYISRQAGPADQGVTLGVLQSLGALARVGGPLVGGLSYQMMGIRAPYYLGAVGFLVAVVLSARLAPLAKAGRPAAAATT